MFYQPTINLKKQNLWVFRRNSRSAQVDFAPSTRSKSFAYTCEETKIELKDKKVQRERTHSDETKF